MRVINVKYIREYLLEVSFEDGLVKLINFKNFLFTEVNPMTTRYRDVELFKQVTIDSGHLSWGIDGEMELSAESLYYWEN